MSKVATRVHGGIDYVWYHCPGCKELHGVPSRRWNWNRNEDSPTLSPSVRHFIPAGDNRPEQTTCHYFVTDGKINYCGDCQHALAGKVVDMIEPENVPDNS